MAELADRGKTIVDKCECDLDMQQQSDVIRVNDGRSFTGRLVKPQVAGLYNMLIYHLWLMAAGLTVTVGSTAS